MSLFSRKETSVALSHSKVFALNAALAALEGIVEDKITPRDYAVLQSPYTPVLTSDGGLVYVTRIAGHFQSCWNNSSSSFVATIYTRHYEDREPTMEYDAISIITIDDYFKYRVEWQATGKFRYQRWENESLTEGWHSSSEGKDIGEFEQQLGLTTVGFLYSYCRIRTLHHLLQWSEAKLANAGIEHNTIEKLKENLEKMGFSLKPNS